MSNEQKTFNICNYGHIAVLYRLSEDIGLLNILKQVFPEYWPEILCIAMYMVTDGSIISGINDWFEESKVDFIDQINDIMCSCTFSRITFTERMRFFSNWVSYIAEKEYIVYDVTSISTYSKNLSDAEFGYNRDGEKLPQINLGMFYGQTSRLPVYYNEYQGSITDVAYLKFMLEHTIELGINKIDFILDRGFVSKVNLSYMYENKFPFIVPLPNGRKETNNIIDLIYDSIKNNENWISEYETYGTCMDYTLYNIPVKVHVFFDHYKEADQTKNYYKSIDKLEKELSSLSNKCKIKKSYTDYFDIDKSSLSDLSKVKFTRNSVKINAKLKYFGFVIFITTNNSYSSYDVLQKYKTRDTIEKFFMYFKDDLTFKRLRTHNNKTTEGKLFVGFISLILKSQLLLKAKSNKNTSEYPLKEILRKLKRIKVIDIDNRHVLQLPISKFQREIFESIGLLVNKIFNKDD
jgi:transposase